MAKYNIKYNDLQNQAASLQSIGKALASFESRLNSIANAMDTKDSSMAALRAQVKACSAQLPQLINRITVSGVAVGEIGAAYLAAEKTAYGAISGLLADDFTIGGNAGFVFNDLYNAILNPDGFVESAELNSFLQSIRKNFSQSKDYLEWLRGEEYSLPDEISSLLKVMGYIDCVYALQNARHKGELDDIASAWLKTGKTVLKSLDKPLHKSLPKPNMLESAGSGILLNQIFNMTENWLDSIASGDTVSETYWNTFANSILDTFDDTVLNTPTLAIAFVPAKAIADMAGIDLMKEYEKVTGETGFRAVTTGTEKLYDIIRENSTWDNWKSGMSILGDKISEGWNNLWK